MSQTTMPATAYYFLALEPDAEFAARIRALKLALRAAAGPQLYLDDPPHLTLYLAAFEDAAAMQQAVAAAVKKSAPRARCTGWHVFKHDALTGNHSLVCEFDAAALAPLAALQAWAAGALGPQRQRAATRARYAAVWDSLDPILQNNIEASGFPFTGAIWRPHVSIASVAPEAWEAAWGAVGAQPPLGPLGFPEIVAYRLEGTRPIELQRQALEGDA